MVRTFSSWPKYRCAVGVTSGARHLFEGGRFAPRTVLSSLDDTATTARRSWANVPFARLQGLRAATGCVPVTLP
jgi:hypothetical protein